MKVHHHPVSDLAAYFAGQWRLHREIVDERGTPMGTFTGEAIFTAEGTELIYHEQGTLNLGDHHAPAHRTLHYRITGPGQASVHFDYGDFFHDLDLRDGHWRAEHPCSADLYQGEFTIQGPDSWAQVWTVSGPTKNHTLRTEFRRAVAAKP
jgi:hypothetical protein